MLSAKRLDIISIYPDVSREAVRRKVYGVEAVKKIGFETVVYPGEYHLVLYRIYFGRFVYGGAFLIHGHEYKFYTVTFGPDIFFLDDQCGSYKT